MKVKKTIFIILCVICALLAGTVAFTLTAFDYKGEVVSLYENDFKAQENERVLVVYFSSDNTSDADAVSRATPRYNGDGATAYAAKVIQKKTGGDLAALTPKSDYPKGYWGTVIAAKKELDADARPEFLDLGVNPEDYDVIFIGYPMWWFKLPMIIYSFFDAYDLSGKTVIPFDTHDGSRSGGSFDMIRAAEPEANVVNGIAVSGHSADKSDSDIEKWLEGLGY